MIDLDVAAHVDVFEAVFLVSAGIALVGALSSFILVGKSDRREGMRVFGRRSRWVSTGQGRSPAITRRPPPRDSSPGPP